MSIKFKIISKKNPKNPAKPAKYYAKTIANGKTDFETLTALIAANCRMNVFDCQRVLAYLELVMKSELSQGKIVYLGDIGNFQLAVGSKVFATKKQVINNTGNDAEINFRPGKGFKKLLNEVEYQKA